MRNFESDIIGRLVAQVCKTVHDMKLHVTLIDRETGQRYNFAYDDWGLTPELAMKQARVDLSNMWGPQ